MFMGGKREDLPCYLLLCIDEAHKFTQHKEVADQINTLSANGGT